MQIILDSLNLSNAERTLCERALEIEGSVVAAASRLGITRHALKRRIVSHGIAWPRPAHDVKPAAVATGLAHGRVCRRPERLGLEAARATCRLMSHDR